MPLDHWHKSIFILWSPWYHLISIDAGRASSHYELDSRPLPGPGTTTSRCHIFCLAHDLNWPIRIFFITRLIWGSTLGLPGDDHPSTFAHSLQIGRRMIESVLSKQDPLQIGYRPEKAEEKDPAKILNIWQAIRDYAIRLDDPTHPS